MSECTRLSDRMPDVARGLTRWSAEEQAHMERCGDCRAEWNVVQHTAALGVKIDIDAALVAARVTAALKQPAPAVAGRRYLRWAVPVALAASLLLVLLRTEILGRGAGETTVELSLLPETETLSDTELESVIRLLPVADISPLTNQDSLSEEEINVMLQDLEG